MPSDLALRYRRLIGDEWLEALWMAMCWTVVEPVTKPVDVDEVVRRLGGGGNEGCEQPVDLDDFNDRHDGSAFYVGQVGSAVAVLEVNGFQGSRPEVLRVLSDGARVHSVFWSVNANRFSYAVYGRTLASFAGTNPYDRYGDDPDVLNSDLADIFEARPDNDELDGDWRSAMLATAQHRTGVALDAEWLSRPHRYVVLPQLPSDPLPPIATSDVDLDAAYRLASQPAQHAARVWLIRRLAADFGFDADPEIAASIAAVAADQAAASGHGVSTADRIYSLTRIPADSSTLLLKREEFEAHPDRRRQDAGFALGTLLGLQTVSGPYPELHALLHVPLAYADQWPAIRTTVRRLLTR